jgi:hypothetical protein
MYVGVRFAFKRPARRACLNCLNCLNFERSSDILRSSCNNTPPGPKKQKTKKVRTYIVFLFLLSAAPCLLPLVRDAWCGGGGGDGDGGARGAVKKKK